jgi:carbonic anhydrase/acetyltransferase-like protein (isoleucine patch superfamily)
MYRIHFTEPKNVIYDQKGMGALIQEGVVVNEEAFIAAGAVVAKHTVIESGELWAGSPAKKLRDLTTEERQKLHFQASEVCTTVSLVLLNL